jgi:predicted nucleotidyltransferase
MDFARPLAVVTPTLEADVLGVLASGTAPLTGREIQRRANASQEGVRRTLDRLTRQGTVLRDRAGNAHLYRLNRTHLAAPYIEALANLRLELLDRLRAAIAAWEVPPIVAVLFGSAARGEAGTESDLDILVVGPGEPVDSHAEWRAQLDALEADTFAWTGNDARVIEYGEGELVRRRADPFLDTVALEGIPLYGSLEMLRRTRSRSK